jgi:phage baseplate assembly protein gpV
MIGLEESQLGARYSGLFRGIVTTNADPTTAGRIKFCIPGFIEPESGWARPITMGGGMAASGSYWVPKVGAEVCVLFNQGDVDQPHYVAGNHRIRADGTADLHERVRSKTPENAPKVHLFETDKWIFVLDDSAEEPAFIVQDKLLGDGIEFDALTRRMKIKSTASISIQAAGTVEIKALNVVINGRTVLPSSEPI